MAPTTLAWVGLHLLGSATAQPEPPNEYQATVGITDHALMTGRPAHHRFHADATVLILRQGEKGNTRQNPMDWWHQADGGGQPEFVFELDDFYWIDSIETEGVWHPNYGYSELAAYNDMNPLGEVTEDGGTGPQWVEKGHWKSGNGENYCQANKKFTLKFESQFLAKNLKLKLLRHCNGSQHFGLKQIRILGRPFWNTDHVVDWERAVGLAAPETAATTSALNLPTAATIACVGALAMAAVGCVVALKKRSSLD